MGGGPRSRGAFAVALSLGLGLGACAGSRAPRAIHMVEKSGDSPSSDTSGTAPASASASASTSPAPAFDSRDCAAMRTFDGAGESVADAIAVVEIESSHLDASGATPRFYYYVRSVSQVRGPAFQRADGYTVEPGAKRLRGDWYVAGVRTSAPRQPASPPNWSSPRVDGEILWLTPARWLSEGAAIADALSRGRCPTPRGPVPSHCRGCAPESDCDAGCCRWVDDSCGDDATCAWVEDCEPACCAP